MVDRYEAGRRRGVVETLELLDQYRGGLDLSQIRELLDLARVAEHEAGAFDLSGLLQTWSNAQEEALDETDTGLFGDADD